MRGAQSIAVVMALAQGSVRGERQPGEKLGKEREGELPTQRVYVAVSSFHTSRASCHLPCQRSPAFSIESRENVLSDPVQLGWL